MYVPEMCRSRQRADLEDDVTEAIWVELHLKKNTVLLCNVHGPPSSDAAVLDHLSDMFERASTVGKEVVVMGI